MAVQIRLGLGRRDCFNNFERQKIKRKCLSSQKQYKIIVVFILRNLRSLLNSPAEFGLLFVLLTQYPHSNRVKKLRKLACSKDHFCKLIKMLVISICLFSMFTTR